MAEPRNDREAFMMMADNAKAHEQRQKLIRKIPKKTKFSFIKDTIRRIWNSL